MKIAIFSDLHGKVLLPFKLVDLYQKETGSVVEFSLEIVDHRLIRKINKETWKDLSL